MMVSWAAMVGEIGGPQLGILVGTELGGLLVGSSSQLGIQMAVWQWQRLLSITMLAGTEFPRPHSIAFASVTG